MSAYTEEVPVLPCMARSYDGAHCGLTDWYDEIEKGLQEALRGDEDFTTGWYSSKKEIASAKVTRIGKEITVEASVSDDFDTPGTGSRVIPNTTDLEKIREAIYAAWEEAEEDQKDNRVWVLYSIHNKDGAWVETYVGPCGMGHDFPYPPGDNYHEWGWQNETDEIPQEDRDNLLDGMMDFEDEVKSGEWTAKMCD